MATTELPEFEHLASLWPLGHGLQVERLTAGRNNDSFYLRSDRGEFVLRRSRAAKTLEALAFEHALISHLLAEGLPVPAIIPTHDGLSWETCGGRLWTVSRFISGSHLVRDENAARIGGGILARFHQAVSRFKPAMTIPPEEDRISPVLSIVDACTQKLPANKPLLTLTERTRHAAEKTRSQIATLAAALSRTIIHGSCRLTSMLMHDGQLVALLDMDSARRGTRAEDIAIALASFAKCRDGTAAADRPALHAFCKAYRTVRNIEQDHIQAIPPLLAQSLLFPWAKALERSVNAAPLDELQLAKAQWRLTAAEHALADPEGIAQALAAA